MRISTPVALALSTILGLLGACRDDATSGPEIEALALSPAAIDVGLTTNVNADFTFADEDGDLTEVFVTLRPAMGTPVDLGAPLMNVTGATAGQARVVLAVTPNVGGDIGVDLYVVDSEDNESNVLTGTLTALDVVEDDCETGGCAEAPLRARLLEPRP